MKTSTCLASILLIMCSHVAFAECTYPKGPDSVPDSKTATKDEMLAAMSAFKQYNTDVDAYVSCLDEETSTKIKEASGAGAIMQIKALQAKKKSSAVDEREEKINAFNKAVREFKARG